MNSISIFISPPGRQQIDEQLLVGRPHHYFLVADGGCHCGTSQRRIGDVFRPIVFVPNSGHTRLDKQLIILDTVGNMKR